jgi:hypothetical protein
MSSLAMDTACSKFRIFLVDFLELQEANGHILHGKKVHPNYSDKEFIRTALVTEYTIIWY